MDRQEFSIVSRNPGETVAGRASLARGLFTLFSEAPFLDDTTTTTEPARSSKTSTVERRTGLTTRAIALTTLATEDLAFFRSRNLAAPEGIQQAEKAVGDLYSFLRQNRSDLAREASRDAAFAKRELSIARAESVDLQNTLRNSKDPVARAAIEGRINLANLRIARLQRLSEESDRVARFFAQIESGSNDSGKRNR